MGVEVEPGACRRPPEIPQLFQEWPDRVELAGGRDVAGGITGLEQMEAVPAQTALAAAAEVDAFAGERAPALDQLDLAAERRVEGQGAEPAGDLGRAGRRLRLLGSVFKRSFCTAQRVSGDQADSRTRKTGVPAAREGNRQHVLLSSAWFVGLT